MKIGSLMTVIIAAVILQGEVKADTTITSTPLGISAYLPDNWIATTAGDTAITFMDTTFTYRSQITCKKQTINATDYPSEESWTRAHFIAYLLIVQYSYDPFGAVLYFDSSETCKQDSLWAPEAFSEFFTIDTALGTWNEYVRYTVSGSNGYQIYAIGDTADMKLNIGMYMAIINMIEFTNSVHTITGSHIASQPARCPVRQSACAGTFDLLGKKQAVRHRFLSGFCYETHTGKIRLRIK